VVEEDFIFLVRRKIDLSPPHVKIRMPIKGYYADMDPLSGKNE
jgi:hypothetical protein